MNESQWLILVGILAPFLIQGIKAIYAKACGQVMDDKVALNVTYVVAIISAAIGKWLAGEAFIPQGDDLSVVIPTLLGQVGVVLAAATVIFKAMMSSSTGVFKNGVDRN